MPKDNRKILSSIRGANGFVFSDGMEDELASVLSQERLNDLVAQGALSGDWKSIKTSGLSEIGKHNLSADAVRELQKAEKLANDFKPLPLKETMKRFEKFDFSDEVMRSMQFHKTAIEAQAAGATTETASGNDNSTDDEDDFPAEFPARSKFIKLGKTLAEVVAMTREQLIELDGIAEKTADEVLVYTKKNA